jgi:SOS-response transcriptional repressor LexA
MLSPTMSSMQNLALDFINRYFARWGQSPTLGELSAHLGTSRKRAHEIVHQLAAKQMIHVVGGKARGIRLIDRTKELSEQDVLARLLAEGWTIGAGSRIVYPPGHVEGVTENGLFLLPLLDHLAAADQTGIKDGETDQG